MELSDVIAVTALIISIVGSVASYYLNYKRSKKQATLEAFNQLQEQALDKLNQWTKKEFQKISDERRMREKDENGITGKDRYNQIRVLLARCEHFSVGVSEDIYDKNTVVSLAGLYLHYLWKKVLPVIEAARSVPGAEGSYKEFEKLVQYIDRKLEKRK